MAVHRNLLVLLPLVVILGSASPAAAGGFELFPGGARPGGRGGASFVGTDSPLALLYNPAQLAGLKSFRFAASMNFHIPDECFQRVVVDPEDPDGDPGDVLPKVCNEGPAGRIPEIGASYELQPGLVVGLGVFAPAAVRKKRWANGRLVLEENGEGADDDVLHPSRYSLLRSELFQVFPTVGIGYEVAPGVRIGGAFGWGIFIVDFTSATDSGLIGDVETNLSGRDLFLPRATLGLHVGREELRGVEFASQFSWTADIAADSTLAISAPQIPDLEIGEADDVVLNTKQTWTFSLGARYAMPLEQEAGRVGDRLATERFDIEADLFVVGGGRVDRFLLDIPNDATVLMGSIDLPDGIILQRRWKTQYIVRLGGDVTILPGQLAARAGFFFEPNGVTDGFESIDFMPFRRFGLSLGATVRIKEYVDVSIAYSHVFQENITVAIDESRQVRNTTSATSPQVHINAGSFEASYDAIMVELGLNL